MLRLLSVALSCTTIVAQDAKLLVTNLSPDNRLGVYWGGNLKDTKELNPRDYAYEKLVDVLMPEYMNSHVFYFGAAFILRSEDMTTRIKVFIDKSDDPARPYRLTIINLSADDTKPQVELKHSKSGFVWIEGTHSVTHETDKEHQFEIRDNKHNPIMSVAIQTLDKSEL